MRQDWQSFTGSKPGRRFRDRYRHRQQSDPRRFSFRKVFNVVVGLAIAVVSLFFGWAPGPGTVTFFLGVWMIAGEFRPLAGLLDWGEVRARILARPIGHVWRSSTVGKVLIVAVSMTTTVTLAYVAYRLFFGG